jgi:acetoin utilization protein AcuC
MKRALLIYSEELARFDYGDDHPFKPIRARNALELCHRYGLLHGAGIGREEPRPADPALLRLFHDPSYLATLAAASGGAEPTATLLARGLGTEDCPLLPGVYEFCLLATGATLLGVDRALAGEAERTFSLVGGFHHAGGGHAEGFCYANDVGVAIAYLLQMGKRVAFVDLDAHHCNGVQDAFYAEDRVLVVSLHESGDTLYPGTGREGEIGDGRGRGFNVNVPLLAGTDDEVYVEAFLQIVPPLLEAYRPDLILAELGADALISDPLTNLRLTNNGYHAAVKELCRQEPPIVAVGGGGYDLYRTARCWTLAWSALADVPPEDDYAGLVGSAVSGPGGEGLFDPAVLVSGPRKDRTRAHAGDVVRRLQSSVFPLLGARPP